MKNLIATLAMALIASCSAFAEEYFVVLKESKVFDEPNASGYVTRNQNDEEVVVKQGMAFRILEKKAGWDMVEYSPGLRALVMQNVSTPAENLAMPKAGYYPLANKASETVNISSANGAWTLGTNGVNYSGKAFGNVVIFFDKAGAQAFSLVCLDGHPIVYSYDNALTRFF